MTRRYSIWVREIASDRDVELMQVDSNPEAIAAQLGQKVLTIKKGIFEAGKRKSKVGKYSRVWIVDNGEA
jgi:hypothetical protein